MHKQGLLVIAIVIAIGFSASAHATLIDMRDGTIYDSDTQLSWLRDASLGGYRTWSDAISWSDNLVFAGFDDWRLPSAMPWQQSGEIGHLYFSELGNVSGGVSPPNTGPFINVSLSSNYWLSSESFPDMAWVFSWEWGYPVGLNTDLKVYPNHVWVVRSGDRSSSVPEPGTLLLLGAGLSGVILFSKRFRRQHG